MARITHVLWYCYNGHRNPGNTRECCQCSQKRFERHANVHTSERAVVYVNPETGEHRTPPRADMPMPDHYAHAGFERVEIESMTAWERKTGVVHEATNFHPGNEPNPEHYEVPTVSKEVKEALIKDIIDANASGPWTGADKIVSEV